MNNFFKKTFTKKRAQSEEMSLQITSMADIFTILLVFLLKSYSTSSITPTRGMLLPQAHAAVAEAEALKVEVDPDSVLVEGQPVAALVNYRFKPGDLMGNGASKSLQSVLAQSRNRQLLIAKANSDVKVDPKILILAGKEAPYSTIKTVLASAALHGYTDFKLAVAKGD